MQLQFAKMHGLGNDFVIFDAVNQDVQLSSEQLRWIADRNLGVGCDQILVIRSANEIDIDFNYQIYNGNGDEVEQCGNGARCIGRFVELNELTNKSSINIKTISGVYRFNLLPFDIKCITWRNGCSCKRDFFWFKYRRAHIDSNKTVIAQIDTIYTTNRFYID